MSATASSRMSTSSHPCYSMEESGRCGLVSLPVAPACNILCRHCAQSHAAAPGRVYAPHEALALTGAFMEKRSITAAGISGPGEPLANEATFETLALIHRAFPHLTLSVSTNGLCLTDRLDDLMRSGVRAVTVTINALTPMVAEKIYSSALYRGRNYSGREAAELIIMNQQRGLINAIDAGFMVKVRTLYMPGVNDVEVPLIAWFAGVKGADAHHIASLEYRGGCGTRAPKPNDTLERLRLECSTHIGQLGCSRCLGDACGANGEKGESAAAHAKLRMREDCRGVA